MKKRNVALFFNFFIIIFEIIGFILTILENGRIGIEYYTEDSNIIAFITSLIFVIYLLLNKEIPYYLRILKYISVICLTVTFLVVILILAPMYNFNYSYLLFHNELLYHHLLCPILCFISFIFYDNIYNYKFIDSVIASLITLLYGIILIFLNIFKIVDGPYPFLKIYNQSIYISVLWAFIILTFTYLIAIVIRLINAKFNSR